MSEAIDTNYYSKETVHDMSFSMGLSWAALTEEAKSYIMDAVNGSRGLAELAIDWARDFDAVFSAKLLVDPDCDTYLEDVGDFFFEKWSEFVAEHVASRMRA